jgi:hypothetical protein
VGPAALGIIQDVESIRHLAELGVVFLLFNIGLELSFDRLRSMGKFVFGMGTLQVGGWVGLVAWVGTVGAISCCSGEGARGEHVCVVVCVRSRAGGRHVGERKRGQRGPRREPHAAQTARQAGMGRAAALPLPASMLATTPASNRGHPGSAQHRELGPAAERAVWAAPACRWCSLWRRWPGQAWR